MAGATYEVDIGDDDLLPPWPTVYEIAAHTDTKLWALVGGLMVQLHARRASISTPRPTRDVDMLVHVQAEPGSYTGLSATLTSLGFTPTVPHSRTAPIYRFARGSEQVDLMVADHLPRWLAPRFQQRPAFVADGGAQALNRLDRYEVSSPTARITLSVPDSLGALVAKAQAYLVDQRDRYRHMQDAAVLLAAMTPMRTLDFGSITKNDRRRLRPLVTELSNPAADAWSLLHEDEADRGRIGLARVVGAAQL